MGRSQSNLARQGGQHRGGAELSPDRRQPRFIFGIGLSLLAVVAAACTNNDLTNDSAPTRTGSPNDETEQASTEPDCSPQPLPLDTAIPADPIEASLLVSSIVRPVCADTVVVTDFEHLERGATEAIEKQAPLVLYDIGDPSTAAAELARLEPNVTIWAGIESDRSAAESAIRASMEQIEDPTSDRVADDSDSGTADAATVPANAAATWIAGPDQATTMLSVQPSIVNAGGAVRQLSSLTPESLANELAGLELDRVAIVDGLDPTERWRVELAIAGTELPGGGTTLFPDRRIIAFYGSPVTFRLGLLGEQGPQATIERLKPVVESYRIGDELIIPGFELIATVADSKSGDDGNYSNELDPEALREWIDVAVDNDVYVIIDLQPGRTDFLTQAKLYEEYLRLPNVGLALDPEWRIGPDEVHLVRVGTVDAAEVNSVVDYLTQIVREEQLPQKALILHQFQLQMITNRELIRTPPELAVVIHVDGQGPLPTKYGTWDTLLGAPTGPDQTLWWAWKNFIDEDFPMATPEETNAVTPLPVVVTFQ